MVAASFLYNRVEPMRLYRRLRTLGISYETGKDTE